MTKTYAVARWEYIEKVKTKSFLLSLFLTPIIMVAMGVLPMLLATRSDTDSKVIGIIDQSGEMLQPLSSLLNERYRLPNGQPNYILRPIPTGTSDDLSSAKRSADSLAVNEAIEGYIVVGKSILTDSTIEYRSMNPGNFKVTERLVQAVRDVIVERKLRSRGFDPVVVRDLTSPVEMRTIKLSKSGTEEEAGFERVFFTAYGFWLMMFFLIVSSGQMLVHSMLEEKSNRVVEVLVSSSSANELMAGKIIGLSALALTQMGFWVLMGVAISINFGITLLPLAQAVIVFVYFILGYLLYAAIFVGAGAPVSTEQEAQQIYGYLVMVLIVPIVFAMLVIQNPNAALVKVLSYIPLLTPSMMAIRIPIQMPSMLEIASTIALLAVSSVAAIWMAGKIFRATILLYGKRPSVRELLNIVRAH